jgi:hypothetical protein
MNNLNSENLELPNTTEEDLTNIDLRAAYMLVPGEEVATRQWAAENPQLVVKSAERWGRIRRWSYTWVYDDHALEQLIKSELERLRAACKKNGSPFSEESETSRLRKKFLELRPTNLLDLRVVATPLHRASASQILVALLVACACGLGLATIVAFAVWAIPTGSLLSELGAADTATENFAVMLKFWWVIIGALFAIAVSADVPRQYLDKVLARWLVEKNVARIKFPKHFARFLGSITIASAIGVLVVLYRIFVSR